MYGADEGAVESPQRLPLVLTPLQLLGHAPLQGPGSGVGECDGGDPVDGHAALDRRRDLGDEVMRLASAGRCFDEASARVFSWLHQGRPRSSTILRRGACFLRVMRSSS